MSKIKKIMSGIGIMIFSVWGGCGYLHYVGDGSWQLFPTTMTMIIGVVVGFVMLGVAFEQ